MRSSRLGVCGTTLAAAQRFPSVSGFVKMATGNRRVKSNSDDGDPMNSRNNFTSSYLNEDDFPPLRNHSSIRKTRIDVGGGARSSKQKSKGPHNNNTVMQGEEYNKNRATTTTSMTDHESGNQSEKSLNQSSSTTPESGEQNIDLMQVKEQKLESSTCVARNQTPYNLPKPLFVAFQPRCLSSKRSIEFHPKEIVDEPFNICVSGRIGKSKSGQVLRPGMVLFKNYIPISHQVDIVSKCQELGCGSGGFYRPGYKDGAKFRLHMMCLGLDWDPQTRKYGEKRKHDDAAPPGIPVEFASLVGTVLNDSRDLIEREMKVADVDDVLPKMSPDLCIVNFYNTSGRLGLHQDRDESRESLDRGLPVVSISIGNSAVFLYGDNRDAVKADSVLLESGDVLVFGGESRLVFHGVSCINPRTAPPLLLQETGLRPGRLNLTFRKY